MMDDEDQMTLVVIAVDSAQLQRAPRHQLQFNHPVLTKDTAMCMEILPLPKALGMAMDKSNHDLGGMLIEMRDMLWNMRGRTDEAA